MDGGSPGDPVEAARDAERAGEWEAAVAGYERALREGPAERAPELLRWIGTVWRKKGDLEVAQELYGASLASAEALHLREHVAAGLNCVGIVEQLRGEMAAAQASYAAAAVLAEELGDSRLAAMVAQNLATLATIRGEADAALHHYSRARDRFRELDDTLAAAWVLNNMGMVHVDLARWDEAESCFAEARILAESEGDLSTRAMVEVNHAELNLRRGDFSAARFHCDQAFELFTRTRSASGVAEVDKIYGILYRDTARPALAETHFARAADAARTVPDPLLEAETLQEWALLHWEMGRHPEAFDCLSSAHRIFSELGARRDLMDLDRRLDQIEETYLRIVKAWGESIEAKDRYTAGHCERVAGYACALAEAVGVAGRDLSWFRMGAFLHDVGKIEVPAEVLNKPDRLTVEEWEMIKRHTDVGEQIVGELGFPWDIRPMVRSHHERWDGSGYPDGLRGAAIPLHARILCVADVYDALTSTRSYKPAFTQEEALRIMSGDAGTLLDPELFERFRAIVAEPAAVP